MKKFPELFTKQLRLGRIEVKCIPEIVKQASDKEIANNTLNFSYPYSDEDAVSWINMHIEGFKNESRYAFAIYNIETDEFIGGVSLGIDKANNKAELGYWIGKSFRNNGFASEAAKRVIQYGFEELKLNKILATHFLFNPASGRVLQKIGMQKEGELRENYLKNNKYEDVALYSILKSEYEKNNQ